MKKFSRIYIEITNVCNMSCSFCKGTKRQPGFMSLDEFEEILTKIKDYTDYIYLHVLGEPLLHPQLKEILFCAKKYGKKVSITTNGTMLSQKKQIILESEAIRKISVSLHSIEEGSLNANEQYLCQVTDFAIEATDRKKLCELRMWNLGDDAEQNRLDMNDRITTFIFDKLRIEDVRIAEIKKHITEKGSVTIRPGLFLGKAERFQWPSLDAEYTNHPVYCHGIRSQLGILCDGTVVPCCLDSEGDVNLGNIFGESLEQIIESPRAKKMYQGFSNRKPSEELCKRCGYATRF